MAWDDPLWYQMRKMQKQIDRLMHSVSWNPPEEWEAKDKEGIMYRKAVTEIKEKDEEYIVNVELPGISKENIEVSPTSYGIEVRANKKVETKQEIKGKKKSKIETKYFGFYRHISLPLDADRENIEASYDEGILKIIIPRKKVARKPKIKVN